MKPAHAGGLANFDTTAGDIILAGLGNVSRSANVHTPYDDFSPRLGLAYKVTQNTVVRAGFGQSYFSSGYDATFYHLTSFYPITAQQTINATNIYQYVFPMQDVPAAAPAPALPASGHLAAPDGTLLKTRNFNFLTENMYSWNLTIERQLDSKTTLSVAYVGTKGTHMSFGQRISTLPLPESDPSSIAALLPEVWTISGNRPTGKHGQRELQRTDHRSQKAVHQVPCDSLEITPGLRRWVTTNTTLST